jgi:pimeloyl-ACP methyl ester carboxylesterase
MKTSSVKQVLDGSELRYVEAGSGSGVILLQGALNGPLADRLSESFRVVTLEVRDFHNRQRLAEALSRVTVELGIAQYCLIADSELATTAIAHTIASGDLVEALILLAPSCPSSGPDIDLPLEELKAPTLVLFGTRDQVVKPETGRIYARRLPKCFYTLVYDAGHDIGADRPQALLAVVRDFLEHREKFLVPHGSSVINP